MTNYELGKAQIFISDRAPKKETARTIWKYQLSVTDFQIIKMPEGSEILSVAVQDGVPCIWAIVDPENELAERKIVICGTGHPFRSTGYNFLGTFQLRGGALIFHCFEEFVK